MSESHQQLLLSLKTVVEGLLSSQVANVWNIYGGLSRLHRVVERIIKHEFTVFKPNGEEDCWVFIKTLGEVEVSNSQFSDPAMAWLQQCLESHTLSGKLSALASDDGAMATCYGERAFLRQSQYCEAALICLRALELNQLALLTDIHPSLYLSVRAVKPDEKLHRRCSSYPENVKLEEIKYRSGRPRFGERKWRSLPCLSAAAPKVASSTQPPSPVATPRQPLSALLKIDYKSRTPVPRRRSLLEGTASVLPARTGGFLKPAVGQSLASFLASTHRQPCAELDRENAHFSISEAIIAAIEQVKYNRWEKLIEESVEESDDEICHLKQRIRLRRRHKHERKSEDEKRSQRYSYGKPDGTPTDMSLSPLSETSSNWSSESPSTEGVDDVEVDLVNSSSLAKSAGISLSMASLYSESDLAKPGKRKVEIEKEPKNEVLEHPLMESQDAPKTNGEDESAREDLSTTAEGVALSLLRKFSDKHLPRASDIDWLVSEKDVPQQLLPLPDSWAVCNDDMSHVTALRGTSQWAPPRPQIIFTIHPPAPRRSIMVKQKYMCAGCGMKVAPEYSHRFRYCDYLGRYFCTGCHSNQTALIPARILFKWDFARYSVSNFSLKLLEQMASDPLFNINDINIVLYKKIRALSKAKTLRLQLYYIKDFLLNCRFGAEVKEKLEKEPHYLLSEPEVYSLDDLLAVRNGNLNNRLSQLMVQSLGHINKCQLCEGRGFVCEICRSREVIYPWQLGKVVRCEKCGTCHHYSCYKGDCPRCLRISARQTSKAAA